MKKSYNIRTFLGGAVTFLLVLVFAAPFYLLVVNSLKTTKEAYASPFTLPADVYWQSFTEVLAGAGINANFVGATVNSLLITAGSLVLLIVFGSLAAYCLARHPGKVSNIMYIFFVIGIIIPSQLGLVPMYCALRDLGLVGNIAGMMILYTCKQITGTAILLNALYIWNDTFDQMVFLSGAAAKTLPVEIYALTTAMTAQWNLVFAAVIISLVPMLILYLLTQKKMMTSLAGGIKG